MNQNLIQARKAQTKRNIERTGHQLVVLHVGGAHVRYICTACRLHFVIEEYRPPERPGYWDENVWNACKPSN